MNITDKEKLAKLYRLRDKLDIKIAKLKIEMRRKEMRRKEFQEIINEKVVYKNEKQKAYRG